MLRTDAGRQRDTLKQNWRRRILNSRIYVIDDQVERVRELCRQLRCSGFGALHAFRDPIAAVENYQKVKPDLILTASDMVNMNGESLIRITRSFPRLWSVPIVVVNSTVAAAVTEGQAQGVLAFPVETKDLVATVARTIARTHRQNRERNNLRWC